MMSEMRDRPWLYWSPATRETVRLELSKLADEVEMDADEMSWAEYPVTRQRYEDVARGLRDLRDVIVGNVEYDEVEVDGPVGPPAMGEESAP